MYISIRCGETDSSFRCTVSILRILAKTTDENLTSENWELILNLCDKVVDDGEQGYAYASFIVIITASWG